MAEVVGVQYSAMNTYTTTTVIWYRKQRVEETQRDSETQCVKLFQQQTIKIVNMTYNLGRYDLGEFRMSKIIDIDTLGT